LASAVTLPDPFETSPAPPPAPPASVINTAAGNVIFLGAMLGVEDDSQNTDIKTAVRLYAQRDSSTGRVWVLSHYTQTVQRTQAHQALISTGIPDPFPPLPPASLAWCVWDTLDNFLNTTYAALQQRHFRTIPNPVYGKLPDQHAFFTGTWRASRHPVHVDKMRSYGVLVWTLNAAVVQLGVAGVPTLNDAEKQQWFQRTALRIQ
ncbi:MAG: hypothetical protein M1823_006534, partial [Watsoniomyces obsoletus]